MYRVLPSSSVTEGRRGRRESRGSRAKREETAMKLTDRRRALTVAVVVGVAVNGWGSIGSSVAQAESEVPATNPLSGDAKAIAEGRSWFRAICAICHGVGADGVGER